MSDQYKNLYGYKIHSGGALSLECKVVPPSHPDYQTFSPRVLSQPPV
jgi:hypothetical protein